MWDTFTVSYEGSTEWRPHMIAPKALKANELSEEQSKDDASLEDEEDNLFLRANSTTEGSKSKQQ